MRPTTANLANDTIKRLEHIADICCRAGLANAAADLRTCATQWRLQLAYDVPVIIAKTPATQPEPAHDRR